MFDLASLNTYVLRNCVGSEARIIAWGATLTSLKIQMASGELREVVLGCDSLDDYVKQTVFLGATVGRVANRVNQARFSLNGQEYELEANQGGVHQLHGAKDLSHRDWNVEQIADNHVRCTISSADGSMGYPGKLDVQLDYFLDDNNQLRMVYHATSDKPCPVNLTDHSYFNLMPDSESVIDHHLWINAAQYLPVSEEGIPLGDLASVEGTGFDFRQSKTVAQDLLKDAHQQLVKGYDHSYLFNSDAIADAEVVARLAAPDHSLTLELITTKPAVQLYTGNFLAGTVGRGGKVFNDRLALCLETQYLPDAPNRDWPHQSCIVSPEQPYQHTTIYRFVESASV